jgi:hypothetical protein
VVSVRAVPPNDLYYDVVQALGLGKDVRPSGKHRATVLGIGMTGRFGKAAMW